MDGKSPDGEFFHLSPGRRRSRPQGFGTGFNPRGSAMVWVHLPVPTGQGTRTRLSPLGSWGLGFRDGGTLQEGPGADPHKADGDLIPSQGREGRALGAAAMEQPAGILLGWVKGTHPRQEINPQNNGKLPKMSSLQYPERCRLGSAVTVLASRFSQQDLGWGRDATARNTRDGEGMLLPETRATRHCGERARGVKLCQRVTCEGSSAWNRSWLGFLRHTK